MKQFYYATDPDCESCKAECASDPYYAAVECGNTLCSWWAEGTCTPEVTNLNRNNFNTCFKNN